MGPAGAEHGAGNSPSEAGDPRPARGNDPCSGAPDEAQDREGHYENPEEQHAGGARQVDEHGHAERGAGYDHRNETSPFGAHRVLWLFQADAERGREVGKHEERQGELERNEVRSERDRDQRRAKPGDAENQRAEKRDPGKESNVGRADQTLTSGLSE